MGKYEIGTVHETRQHGPLKVIGYIDTRHRMVQFINTGYTISATTSSIHLGNVKDVFTPSVMGVGYLGESQQYETHPLYRTLYRRWSKMIERIHYRGSRKSIAPEWYCFATFMHDALELKGIELLYQHSKETSSTLIVTLSPLRKVSNPYIPKKHVNGFHARLMLFIALDLIRTNVIIRVRYTKQKRGQLL